MAKLSGTKKSGLKLGKMAALGDDIKKKYGDKSARMGSEVVQLNVIPSGILAFDYASGIGGFPRGHATGIYGLRDIGKSVHAAMGVASAQSMGLDAAWIAYETTVDVKWMQRFGVDTDELLILYPKTGEEAFSFLYRVIEAEAAIAVFDSLCAVLGESETGADGKARQGGQAGLITWGMKNCVPLAYHTNTALIMLNQGRVDMKSKYGGLMQGGGNALEHLEAMIVHLKGGKNRYKMGSGDNEIQIGTDIVALFERNKLAEGSRAKALYSMYFKETKDNPLGLDITSDIINTGMRSGVINRRGAIYDIPVSMDPSVDPKAIKSSAGVEKYIKEHPECLDVIRNHVLASLESTQAGPKLEIVS